MIWNFSKHCTIDLLELKRLIDYLIRICRIFTWRSSWIRLCVYAVWGYRQLQNIIRYRYHHLSGLSSHSPTLTRDDNFKINEHLCTLDTELYYSWNRNTAVLLYNQLSDHAILSNTWWSVI